MQKPFDPELCKKYDYSTKSISLSFFGQYGYKLKEETLDMAEDEMLGRNDLVLVNKDGKELSIEVETKAGWRDDKSFSVCRVDKEQSPIGKSRHMSSIRIPERKAKSQADLFVIVNFYGTAIAVVKKADFKESRTVQVNTCQWENDLMRDVPLYRVKFFVREKHIWKNVSIDVNSNLFS